MIIKVGDKLKYDNGDLIFYGVVKFIGIQKGLGDAGSMWAVWRKTKKEALETVNSMIISSKGGLLTYFRGANSRYMTKFNTDWDDKSNR